MLQRGLHLGLIIVKTGGVDVIFAGHACEEGYFSFCLVFGLLWAQNVYIYFFG